MLILEKYLLRAEVKKVGSWWKPPPPSSSPPVLRSKILGFFLKLYCVFFFSLAVGLFSIILPTVVIAIKLGENRYKVTL